MARRRRTLASFSIGLGLWLLVSLGVGCGGKFVSVGRGDETRFRHRELGYEIAYPSVLKEPGWKIEPLDESDLMVRNRDGSAWAMASHCRATKTSLKLLAAELTRAARAKPGPGEVVELAGLSGWKQRDTAIDKGIEIEIETVTLRSARCIYDWILLAPSIERFKELEPRFDAWWRTFEPGPGDEPAKVES